ncbi:MAG: FAD-dependent oxidoreductase, partial [Elusimicrobiota bacterium]
MSCDAIVIGAGHNGLSAAASLARKGRKVLLLEKCGEIGGLAAGTEFHPKHRSRGLLLDTSGV